MFKTYASNKILFHLDAQIQFGNKQFCNLSLWFLTFASNCITIIIFKVTPKNIGKENLMFHSYEVMFSLLSIVPLSCRLKIHCDLFHYNFNISVCPLKVQKTKTEYGVRQVHSMKPKNWYPFCRMKTWSSMINSVGKHSN